MLLRVGRVIVRGRSIWSSRWPRTDYKHTGLQTHPRSVVPTIPEAIQQALSAGISAEDFSTEANRTLWRIAAPPQSPLLRIIVALLVAILAIGSWGVYRYERELRRQREVDYGGLLVATKHLYFGGPHATFRIPYENVIRFEPFSSGIGIFRDSANAKAEVFTVLEANPNGGNPVNARPLVGWFLYNMAHFLAQPGEKSLHAPYH
jgi:hypothetical protein